MVNKDKETAAKGARSARPAARSSKKVSLSRSKGILIVISAPSGAGKTTLVREISKAIPEIHYSISFTTRHPRREEAHGRDYFFVNEDEFKKRKDRGELIECAYVHGSWYGTPRDIIEENLKGGFDTLLDIDVQGGKQIKNLYPDAVLVFVVPPSLSILETRLRDRKQDDEATIRRRLAAAKEEMKQAPDYDYLLVNDQITHAIEQLRCIITAERLRTSRHTYNRF